MRYIWLQMWRYLTLDCDSGEAMVRSIKLLSGAEYPVGGSHAAMELTVIIADGHHGYLIYIALPRGVAIPPQGRSPLAC